MPLWRCPHCATPQPEAARCWVCRRSTTSCGTCRHFRPAVASGLGYCGLDRQRLPLRGDEMRACWSAPGSPSAQSRADEAHGTAPESDAGRGRPALPGAVGTGRTFVPVDTVEPVATRSRAPRAGRTRGRTPAPAAAGGTVEPPRWSLWADLEG